MLDEIVKSQEITSFTWRLSGLQPHCFNGFSRFETNTSRIKLGSIKMLMVEKGLIPNILMFDQFLVAGWSYLLNSLCAVSPCFGHSKKTSVSPCILWYPHYVPQMFDYTPVVVVYLINCLASNSHPTIDFHDIPTIDPSYTKNIDKFSSGAPPNG